jgi:hypothetical protein
MMAVGNIPARESTVNRQTHATHEFLDGKTCPKLPFVNTLIVAFLAYEIVVHRTTFLSALKHVPKN